MDERRDFDCLDFKLMLTALVDGTAPPDGRQIAERHALACPSCLRLLEDAEATDFMLRLSARAEPVALSDDFADRVIGATRAEAGVSGDAPIPFRRSAWRESVAWLAAAAAIVIAATLWIGRSEDGWRTLRGSGSVTTIASPVFSGVRELTDADLSAARERAQSADAIAALLSMLASTLDEIELLEDANGAAAQLLARRVVDEELPARVALLRISLPQEMRPDLQAAEAALVGLSAGCLDATRLEELQTTLRAIGLAQRLRDLARRVPRTLAAA